VVHACSLEHDLTVLPQGEKTNIGEKGIILSGLSVVPDIYRLFTLIYFQVAKRYKKDDLKTHLQQLT
jgi:hypothetical protein